MHDFAVVRSTFVAFNFHLHSLCNVAARFG